MKFWIAWIFGVFIALFAVSLWQNGEIDWDYFYTLSIGGFIGTAIGLGIKKAFKKDGN